MPSAWLPLILIGFLAAAALAFSSLFFYTHWGQLGFLLVVELSLLVYLGWARGALVLLVWKARRFRTRTGPRLVFHYDARLEASWDLTVLQQCLEAQVDDLSRRLGLSLGRRVVVFFFVSHKIFRQVVGTEASGLAFMHANIVCLADDADPHRTMRHELAHLFGARLSARAPAFLQEGLATWLESDLWEAPIDALAGVLLRRVEVSLPHLLQGGHCPACYVLAGSLTAFLIRRYGWDRYCVFYRRASRIGFHLALRRVFDLGLDELNRQWRAEVLGREGRAGS